MSRFKNYILKEKREMEILLKCIPATVVTLFVVSVVCMNLLANKTILQLSWIAIDGGMLISWLSFMCMDMITKHFGMRASNKISFLAAGINLLCCLIFFVVSIIPSSAADYSAFDSIFGGVWFILLSSTIAFLLSAFINNMTNHAVGKLFKNNPHGKTAYATQSYISTFVGQFFDNFIFSVMVFMFFAPIYWQGFHWSLLQCTMCALAGAVAELVMEVLFSPIGYEIVKKWRSEKVGEEYLLYISEGEKK